MHHSRCADGGSGNVHQVDVVAGDELGITTEGQGNRVLRGEVLRTFEIRGDAMATTSAPSSASAGVTMPRGAIRAAPNIPMRIMARVSHDCGRCGTLSLQIRDREHM